VTSQGHVQAFVVDKFVLLWYKPVLRMIIIRLIFSHLLVLWLKTQDVVSWNVSYLDTV